MIVSEAVLLHLLPTLNSPPDYFSFFLFFLKKAFNVEFLQIVFLISERALNVVLGKVIDIDIAKSPVA